MELISGAVKEHSLHTICMCGGTVTITIKTPCKVKTRYELQQKLEYLIIINAILPINFMHIAQVFTFWYKRNLSIIWVIPTNIEVTLQIKLLIRFYFT